MCIFLQGEKNTCINKNAQYLCNLRICSKIQEHFAKKQEKQYICD